MDKAIDERKAFSKFYRRHYEFYGDLVYKFNKMRGVTDFSDQFRKIIMRYKRIGYNLNVNATACMLSY